MDRHAWLLLRTRTWKFWEKFWLEFQIQIFKQNCPSKNTERKKRKEKRKKEWRKERMNKERKTFCCSSCIWQRWQQRHGRDDCAEKRIFLLSHRRQRRHRHHRTQISNFCWNNLKFIFKVDTATEIWALVLVIAFQIISSKHLFSSSTKSTHLMKVWTAVTEFFSAIRSAWQAESWTKWQLASARSWRTAVWAAALSSLSLLSMDRSRFVNSEKIQFKYDGSCLVK